MLFWLSILNFIGGLVLAFNGATWFEGEDNVAVICIILSVVLMVIYLALTYVAVKAMVKLRKSMRGIDRP